MLLNKEVTEKADLEGIDYWVYWLPSVLTTECIDYWVYWLLSVLTTECIDCWVYWLLSVLTTECIDFWVYWLPSVLTTECIDYWVYWLPSVLTTECIDYRVYWLLSILTTECIDYRVYWLLSILTTGCIVYWVYWLLSVLTTECQFYRGFLFLDGARFHQFCQRPEESRRGDTAGQTLNGGHSSQGHSRPVGQGKPSIIWVIVPRSRSIIIVRVTVQQFASDHWISILHLQDCIDLSREQDVLFQTQKLRSCYRL